MRVRSGHRAMGHPPAPSPRSRGCSVELLSQVSGGEIAPPGSLRTGGDSLPSSGSYGSASGDQNKPQWANRRGSRWMMALSHAQALTHLSFSRLNLRVAQRGHAKQKRTDLRLMGLGLVVSTDFGVPLVSHAYAGNRPDVTQFADMVSWEGVERHQLLPVLGDLLGGLRPLGLVVLDELIECPLSVVAVFGVTDLFEGGIGQCH